MGIVLIIALALYVVSVVFAVIARTMDPTYYAVLSAVTLYVLSNVL